MDSVQHAAQDRRSAIAHYDDGAGFDTGNGLTVLGVQFQFAAADRCGANGNRAGLDSIHKYGDFGAGGEVHIQAVALLINNTEELLAVVRVLPIWKMKTALGLP